MPDGKGEICRRCNLAEVKLLVGEDGCEEFSIDVLRRCGGRLVGGGEVVEGPELQIFLPKVVVPSKAMTVTSTYGMW